MCLYKIRSSLPRRIRSTVISCLLSLRFGTRRRYNIIVVHRNLRGALRMISDITTTYCKRTYCSQKKKKKITQESARRTVEISRDGNNNNIYMLSNTYYS